MIQRHRQICSNVITLTVLFGGITAGVWYEIDWLVNEISHYKKKTCLVAQHDVEEMKPDKFKLQFAFCPHFKPGEKFVWCNIKTWKTIDDVTYNEAAAMLEDHRPLQSNLTCWQDARYANVLHTNYNYDIIIYKYASCVMMLPMWTMASLAAAGIVKSFADEWLHVYVADDVNILQPLLNDGLDDGD